MNMKMTIREVHDMLYETQQAIRDYLATNKISDQVTTPLECEQRVLLTQLRQENSALERKCMVLEKQLEAKCQALNDLVERSMADVTQQKLAAAEKAIVEIKTSYEALRQSHCDEHLTLRDLRMTCNKQIGELKSVHKMADSYREENLRLGRQLQDLMRERNSLQERVQANNEKTQSNYHCIICSCCSQ
jgi:hypothetical protein